MGNLLQFTPIIIPLVVLFFLYVTITLFRKYKSLRRRRAPFTDNFLRSPGEFLRLKIDKLSDDITQNFITMIVGPLLFYFLWASKLFAEKVSNPSSAGIVTSAIALLLFVYFVAKTIHLINVRQNYRLGYDAEIAVAQELNRLMLRGYHVYHDVPGKKFNIDHVIVGPAGVFAVETKGRLKPTTSNRAADAQVVYDGKRLQFPDRFESKPLQQAQRQGKWLSHWLSSATGEPVKVRPVVALPGWFVKRTAPNGIPVVNPKQIEGLLKISNGPALDAKLIGRIVHQLEQLCRNVQPMSAEMLGESKAVKN